MLLSATLAVQAHQAFAQSPSAAQTVRLEIVAGSKAEYRVREQLARLNFPNDAVGTTEAVSGALVIGPDGTFVPSGSKISVDLRTIKSDYDRRDSFVRENTLETDRFPRAEFVARRQQGLSVPLPSSGERKFRLIGDMTLHGVTSELTWDVTATFNGDAVTGEATTRFDFAKFRMTIPKVFGLISVDDDIRLVLNFKARRAR